MADDTVLCPWWWAENSILAWILEVIPKAELSLETLTTDLKDGRLMCCLMEALVPGVCPNPELLCAEEAQANWRLASRAAEFTLGVISVMERASDAVCESNAPLDDHEVLITCLQALRYAVHRRDTLKLPLLDKEVIIQQIAIYQVIANGEGLKIAEVERHAQFTLHLHTHQEIDLNVEIKSISGYSCSHYITSKSISEELNSESLPIESKEIPLAYKVCKKSITITWIPRHTCSHRVSILWHRQHLYNSPYQCQVSSHEGKIPPEIRAIENTEAIISSPIKKTETIISSPIKKTEAMISSPIKKTEDIISPPIENTEDIISSLIENTEAILSPPMEDKSNDIVRERFMLRKELEKQDSLIAAIMELENAKSNIPQEIQAIDFGLTDLTEKSYDCVRKRSGLRNELEKQDSLNTTFKEIHKAEGKPKATALTKGRKGRPPSPKPQDIFSSDDEEYEVFGRFGHTILEVRKGMVLEKRNKWEEKQMNKETSTTKKSGQRPKYLPFSSKKNTLQFSSGHILPSPSLSIPSTISIPSTPSSEVFRMLTPPPEGPDENMSFLQSIKGKVAEHRKRFDSLGSLASSCDNLDEYENCSQDEADAFTGLYTPGKVKDRKNMWETKIKEIQKENEKPSSRKRYRSKKSKSSSRTEQEKCFTSDEELDTLRHISRRVSRSGSLKYILHNTTDGNIYMETTDDELIKSYVGDDTPPSSIEYSLEGIHNDVAQKFTTSVKEENRPIAPIRRKKSQQKGRMEVARSSPQYPSGAGEDLAKMLTTSSLSHRQLNPAGDLRCYLVHSAHHYNRRRSMSLPDINSIVPSNYEDTFETGENYKQYKEKFASARRFFEVASSIASRESDINSDCGDICNRYKPINHKKIHEYHSDDGFERYFYVEKNNYLDIDQSTERSSSRNSVNNLGIQTEYLSRDIGIQSSADSTPTHCPSCQHGLDSKSRSRKRRSMKTYNLAELPKIKRKIIKSRQGQYQNDVPHSLQSSDIDCYESNALRNNAGEPKPWHVNPVDGKPWISSLRQNSLPYGGIGMESNIQEYNDEETNQHSLPYGGLGTRAHSNIYSDDDESWSMRVKNSGGFGFRNPSPLVASLKDLSRNLPSPYPDAPQDILDDLDHSVFQNVPRGQVIHTLGGLYNKEYPHIPISQFRRGTPNRNSKNYENLITHKDLKRSSLHSLPDNWKINKSVHSLRDFSDVNDDHFNLENESITSTRTSESPVPLPRTKSLGLNSSNFNSSVYDNSTNSCSIIDQLIDEEISRSEAEFIARNVGKLKERLDNEMNYPSSEFSNEGKDHGTLIQGMDYSEPSCPSSSDEDEQDPRLHHDDQSMDDLTNEPVQHLSMISQDLQSCRAYGLGLEWGKVDRVNTFTIDTNGATSGEVTVSVEGPHEGSVSRTEVYPVDEEAGLYQVHYTVTTPATYLLAITWANQHILGSPFMCYVED